MEKTNKKNLDNALNNFLSDEEELEFEKKVQQDKNKFIKSDHTIIERIDRQIITEDGRMLLREQY